MDKTHTKNISFLKNLLSSGKIKAIPSSDFKIEYFKSGGGTHLYLIQSKKGKFLGRVNYYPLKNSWKVRENEFRVLKMLEPLKIAPKAIYLDASEKYLGQHFNIVEFVEGKPIKKVNKKIVIELAQTLKKLHQIKFKKPGILLPPNGSLPYHLGVYEEFANGEDKQIEKYANFPGIKKIIPVYNKMKLALAKKVQNDHSFDNCQDFCLCHSDLKLENALSTKSGACLIDWECACSDVAETDLGRIFSGAQLPPAQEKIFLKEYYGKQPVQVILNRIHLVRQILDFFRIIEDYCIIKRKPWNPDEMLKDLRNYQSNYF